MVVEEFFLTNLQQYSNYAYISSTNDMYYFIYCNYHSNTSARYYGKITAKIYSKFKKSDVICNHFWIKDFFKMIFGL